MLAGRYLRTRRREGFVSVIAGFSFLGIMLGVATLIVVLSVMNGFRKELLDKIVGINGHIFVAPHRKPAHRLRGGCGPHRGRAGRQARHPAGGRAGLRLLAIQRQRRPRARHPAGGSAQDRAHRRQPAAGHASTNFENGEGVAIGRRLADALSLQAGDTFTLITPRGAVDALRHGAAGQGLSGEGDLRDRHVGIRFHLRLHAADRGAELLQPPERRAAHRGLSRQCRPGRPGPRRHRRGGRPADPHDRLAPAQPHLLRRARSRAQRDVPDPHADRAGGGAQHHLRPHHAREGQVGGHRDPAHHGRDARLGHARVPDHRRVHRHRRHDRGLRPRPAARAQCRDASATSSRG